MFPPSPGIPTEPSPASTNSWPADGWLLDLDQLRLQTQTVDHRRVPWVAPETAESRVDFQGVEPRVVRGARALEQLERPIPIVQPGIQHCQMERRHRLSVDSAFERGG